ncbi:hypothetical protein PFISCL1PPCAC_1240, partial [Pristionchus fissidentatus]
SCCRNNNLHYRITKHRHPFKMSVAALPQASGKINKFAMTERHLGFLQEMVRKHPESYKEEFLEQYEHFMQTIKLLHLQPVQHRMDVQPLLDSVTFLSGVVVFYAAEAKAFGDQMLTVLREQSTGLDPHVRMAFCKALIPLRNKNYIEPLTLLELFFELVKLEDKHLRKFILSSISSHLKVICVQKKNLKLAGKIQNFCYAKLKDSRSIVVRCAQLILIDAFRKKYFRDTKTANAISEGCFHKIPKIQVAAMKFFIGSKADEDGEEELSDDEEGGGEEEGKTLKEVMNAFRYAKKTKKREKDLEKAKKAISKKKKAKKESRSKECNLLAVQSMYDPQEFGDRLFKMLESTKVEKFEVRLFRLALLARIIGIHRLQTLQFYSWSTFPRRYVQRYLQPKQRDVTRILLYAAQACHELVPPDTVENLVRCIAYNFVTDRNSPEAITVGINAIREILNNCPFAATEELLRDLAEYKTYKNKNVSMAARALITLFRQVNPKLLHKRDRGRLTAEQTEGEDREYLDFGVPAVREFVPGAECLPEEREENGEMEIDEEEVEKSDDEDGWVNVHHGADVSEDEEGEGEEDEDEDDEDEEGEWETDDEEGAEEEEDDDDEEEDGEDEEESGEEEEEEEDEEGEKKVESKAPTQSKKLKRRVTKAEMKAEIAHVPKEKAVKVSEGRILTQEEFKKINQFQIKKALVSQKKIAREIVGTRKRTNDDDKLDEEYEEKRQRRVEGDGLPRLRDIEHFHKKMRRATKEERMESIMEGREGREDYGKRKKNGPHVGKTNRENAKKKVFSMVKNKIRGKNRQRSFRDQQTSLKNYLLRQAGHKPGN